MGKCMNLNRHNSFKFSLYFRILGWKKFVGLKVEYIYLRLARLFFANAPVDLKIFETKSFIKERYVTMNEKYLHNLLKLKPNGLRVALGNRLITSIPTTLTGETQLRTVFGPKFSDYNVMPAHTNLLLESHIQHNMVNQMIIPCTG